MMIKAKVFPKSKFNLVEQVMVENEELSMVVRVTAAPEKGNANSAVIKQIAKFLDINQSSVELVRGHRCKNKVFRVNNFTKENIKNLTYVLTI